MVKNADEKSLIEISLKMSMLNKKAQTRTILPDEVKGGTFTLTAVGRQGESRFRTPMLNQSEVAILRGGRTH